MPESARERCEGEAPSLETEVGGYPRYRKKTRLPRALPELLFAGKEWLGSLNVLPPVP
jgi:hypothetical protein